MKLRPLRTEWKRKQGQPISEDEMRMMTHAYLKIKQSDPPKNKKISRKAAMHLAADLLGVGRNSMFRHVAPHSDEQLSLRLPPIPVAGNTTNHPAFDLDDEGREKVREYIRARHRTGASVKNQDVQTFIMEKLGVETTYEKVRGLLRRMGYVYGHHKGTDVAKMSDENQEKLRNFLEELFSYGRGELDDFEVMYIDEAYIRPDHRDFMTYGHDIVQEGRVVGHEGVFKTRAGTGKWLLMGGMSTKFGVAAMDVIAKRNSPTNKDYHSDFNTTMFVTWVLEKLFPAIRGVPHLIVLDNASYHKSWERYSPRVLDPENPQVVRPKVKEHYVRAISFWQNYGPNWSDELYLKDIRGNYGERNTLNDMKRELRSYESRWLENLAEAEGHRVVWNAPYWSELNAIERLWALMKNEVARKFRNNQTWEQQTAIVEDEVEKYVSGSLEGGEVLTRLQRVCLGALDRMEKAWQDIFPDWDVSLPSEHPNGLISEALRARNARKAAKATTDWPSHLKVRRANKNLISCSFSRSPPTTPTPDE